MSEAEFAEFKDKIAADEEERKNTSEKIEEKLERRKAKKELKKNVQDTCKTQ